MFIICHSVLKFRHQRKWLVISEKHMLDQRHQGNFDFSNG